MADIHNSQQCDHDLGAPLLCAMSNNPPSVCLWKEEEEEEKEREGRAGIWSAFVKLHGANFFVRFASYANCQLKQSLQ